MLFKDRYRVESTRLSNWNYGWNGCYFITICTKNSKHYFGSVEIKKGQPKMELSDIGMIAEECWRDIPEHFPFIELGAFIVMPNHLHGIIFINKSNCENPTVETQDFASLHRNPTHDHEETQNLASLPQNMPKNQFGPQSRNLGSIIRGYKCGVTKYARGIDQNFCWLPLYYDTIIRNTKSYQRIENYIISNPKNWAKDKFYSTDARSCVSTSKSYP